MFGRLRILKFGKKTESMEIQQLREKSVPGYENLDKKSFDKP